MTGDFRDLEAYRGELRLHCYRILGSLTDAEDVVQETLLAAWQGLSSFEGRSSVRTWLYRIATNRSLNAARDRARRPPVVPEPPFDPPAPTRHNDVTWLEPLPSSWYESKEAVELAFVTALQRMPPRQAAALILHDVLSFSTVEVASLLETTPTAVKGMLQRARATAGSADGPAPAGDVGRRFADAFMANDVDAVVALLTDDTWLAMPPAPHEYLGPAAVASFLRASGDWRGSRPLVLVETRANAQVAYGCYLDSAPAGLMVLTVDGGRISGLTRFLTADLTRFDLTPR